MMAIHIPKFESEIEILKEKDIMLVGVDEVGRGPLCGPVIAAAALFRHNPSSFDFRDKKWDLVRDSKTLSEKQREKAFDFIHEHFYVGIGLCNHETIDRINILESSFLAMKKAVAALTRGHQSLATGNQENAQRRYDEYLILVDGNKQIPNFSHQQKTVVGGDSLVSSIAAASIVAKVTRDRLMVDLHKRYPQYGFDRHKGYGTKLHLEMLKLYGPCEIHRKSFAPVAACLE